ncbi:hypothetical protein [Pedobacter ureilyticus]|uniref:Lipoprotein n=1 Tax=Pedobacter ureilyticus TaxID=1393051 RepID=A0ABW9J1U7_9SPHI|nr:hypothetical protein [Pedobacter helvus]
MKNLFAVVVLAGLLLTTNGCGVLKNKHLEKHKLRENVKNDIAVSTVKIDSSKANVVVSKAADKKYYSEEINIKRTDPLHNIELVANFKVDTNATLSGDTALKLVDMKNNGVSLSIYQNKKTNQLMAKVTTPNGTQTTSFSEINIKRNYAEDKSTSDSSYAFENHSELKRDSLDKTETRREEKHIVDKKEKQTKIDWKVWIGAIAVVCFFIWLGFRKKK